MPMFASVIAVLLELGGIGILGYAWFHTAASGKEIHALSVQELRGPLQPFVIDLDPSMNPVEFRMSARVDGTFLMSPQSEEQHNYRGMLSLDRKPVMDKVVQLKSEAWGKNEKRPLRTSLATQTFGQVEIASAGRHQFALSSAGGSIPMAFRDTEVSVRRNVAGFDRKKLWWGIGLIVVGGLIQALFGAPLPGGRSD